MDKFRKIYNKSIKELLQLNPVTPHRIINQMMDCWNVEAVRVQSYVRNANLWMETYSREIINNREDELYDNVIKRYDEIRIKIGKKPEDRTYIEKLDVEKAYRHIYNANTNWTFKNAILNKEKPLSVIKWQAKWQIGLPKNL